MKAENKSTKKLFIIGGAVAGGLTLLTAGILIGMFVLNANKENNGDLLTAEQIELYEELPNTHAHYSNDNLISIPKEELEFSPVDGIDYSSAEIRNAFDDLYGSADSAVSVITNDNAVYNESDKPPKVTKRNDSANPDAPRPAVYTGGIDIRPEGRGDLFDVDDLAGSDLWAGLGDIVSDYIEAWSDPGDGNGYGEWNDPDFWKLFADYIIERIKDELINAGHPLNPEALANMISDALIEYASEQWGDDIQWGGLGDIVDDYVNEEWSDPGDMSDPGLDWENEYDPGYDMDEINYRTMGRLFYREALSSRQQRAYDVLATAIQRGNFNIEYYDFKITNDEARAVIDAVVWDNPEFSFIRGHSYGPYDAETITVLEVLLDDDIMQIGIDKMLRDTAARAAPVIAAAKKLNTDIDKVKYIVDHLCSVNVYSANPEKCKYSQSMYSAIVTNETICSGYASAFHYYMNALNIDATRLSSCNHLWNLVQLDGDYYYMDVTWADTPHWKVIDGKATQIDTNYDWFNFNETQANAFMKKTDSTSHRRDYISVLLPAANGTKYSYANWYDKEEQKPNKSSATSKPDDSWNDPGHSIPLPTTTPPPATKPQTTKAPNTPAPNTTPPSDDPPAVAINGVDVSGAFDVIEIDGVYFAEGESFIESIRDSDMPASMRSYNYDYTQDDDEIYAYLDYWFDPDRGNFLDSSYLHLLELDAIIIYSWFTDSIMCMFFIDSPYAFVFSDMDTLTLWTLDDAPQLVDGEAYIPMKEFSDVMGFEIAISN